MVQQKNKQYEKSTSCVFLTCDQIIYKHSLCLFTFRLPYNKEPIVYHLKSNLFLVNLIGLFLTLVFKLKQESLMAFRLRAF